MHRVENVGNRPGADGYRGQLSGGLFSKLASQATMRVISLDQFEFESSSSEESLEIAVASRSKFPFPNVESFIAARIGAEAARHLPEPVAFERRLGLGQMVDYLNRFAGIAMPDGCEWPVYRLSTEWDEQKVVVCAPTESAFNNMEISIVTGRLALFLLSCASASLPLTAGAASGTVDPDSIAVTAPEFAAGSHWTFHVRHRHSSKLDESDLEWQMIAKNASGDWIFYRGKPVPPSGAAGTIQTTTSFTSSSWNGRNSTGASPDDLKEIPLSFPLSMGKTWDVVYDRAFGSVWAHLERHYRVVGWEDVSVPAGRFHALKVVMDGGNWRLPAAPDGVVARRPEAPPNVSLHHESWYVPTVQNQVRSVEVATAPGVSHPDEYEMELTEFGLATQAR